MRLAKILCIILLLSAFAVSLPSCENSAVTETTTNTPDSDADPQRTETATSENPFDIADKLPVLDYNGLSFNILAPDSYNGASTVESENGEALNDAIYKSAAAVEERLNITIGETLTDFWTQGDTVKNLIMAGDLTYNVYTMHDNFAYNAVVDGYFLPITALDYIDLEQPYWGGALSEQFIIAGRQYFAFGSYNLSSYEHLRMLCFNKRLIDANDLELPYQCVLDGSWTLDKFGEMCIAVTADADGDGTIGSDGDIFGLTAQIKNIAPSFWISAGERTVKTDGDYMPYFALVGNEKFINVLEKVHSLCYDDKTLNADANFTDGNVLFSLSRMETLISLRDMEDDFGILPLPKYDETQNAYYSRDLDCMFTMAPLTCEDTEMTGAVLEAMASEGYRTIIPAYYETCLKTKYTRDGESSRTIDILFEGRAYDIGDVILTATLGDEIFANEFIKTEMNLTSLIEKKASSVDKQLAKMVEIFTKEPR